MLYKVKLGIDWEKRAIYRSGNRGEGVWPCCTEQKSWQWNRGCSVQFSRVWRWEGGIVFTLSAPSLGRLLSFVSLSV